MNKKLVAKILNLIGILLMVTVILVMVPLTVPKLFGIRIYGVLTGSMTPAYTVGGVVYVKETDAELIKVGDVITYSLGSNTDYVMTHRVVEIDDTFFITKGDANNEADPEPVSYDRVIGKVVLFVPGMSDVAEFVNSATGRSVFIILFAAAFMMWITADILMPSKRKSTARQAADELPVLSERKRHGGSRLIQLAGVVLMLGAVVYLGSVFLSYEEATGEYDALEDRVFTEEREEDSFADSINGEVTLSKEETEILAGISKLREENPDIIGWIKFDNLELSYPIMQGEDNDYYLNHTFSGEVNGAGSIFMEAKNTPDFDDSHTIIYGHNMKNRSMFGSLKSYKTEDFYPGNEYFSIYTPDKIYRYQIFAYYDISMYGEIYDISFENSEEFQGLINSMCRRSYYDTNVTPDSGDKVITLSTCSTEGNRFVINAFRISEKTQ